MAQVKLDRDYEVHGGKVRKKAKYALPDIEHDAPQPSGRGSIRTPAEYEADERAAADSDRARHARAEASRMRAERSLAKERDAASGSSSGSSGGAFSWPQLPKAIRNPKHSRRLLLAEAVAAAVLITIREAADGNAPKLRSYTSAFAVYFVLGFASEVGDDTARLAAAMGGLVLLAIAMAAAPAIVATSGALGIPTTDPTIPTGDGAGGGGIAPQTPGGSPRRARVTDRRSLRTGARHPKR